MSKIKIKNFGPIKEGFTETLSDGTINEWIDVKKVTVFIGNQGSGKSTVAKLISTLTWIEKALVRGDFNKQNLTYNKLKKICAYQNIDSYFKGNSLIEYIGKAYSISCIDGKVTASAQNINIFSFPKIMYVPSERNFISSVKNIYDLRGLPKTLYTFSDEVRLAKEELMASNLLLPINNTKFEYNKHSGISWIVGRDYRVELSNASSGFHSFVPMYLVSRYLSIFINKDSDPTIKEISIKDRIKIKEEIKKIYSNKKYSDDIKNLLVEQLSKRIKYSSFINIVEEPEQNLFPSSQQKMLNSLLEFNNTNDGNKLILTTHSPYLLVYLTLSVEANKLKQKVITEELKSKLNDIVPLSSTVEGHDLVVYQLDENNGTIERLKDYKGLPSDENKLNNGLADANDEFSKLLDLEDLCQ